MAGKSLLTPYRVVTNGNMATNVTQSIPTQLEKQDNIAFHAIWSGTSLVGRFIVEATNTDPRTGTPVWSELIMDQSTAVPADSGDGWFNIKQFPGTWIRFRYAATSGTGTLNVTLSAKGLG